jgi:hypothetical protein
VIESIPGIIERMEKMWPTLAAQSTTAKPAAQDD